MSRPEPANPVAIPLTSILMAKSPVEGAAKTRLIGPAIDAAAASAIALSMLRCIATRLVARFERVVLACSPDSAGCDLARALEVEFDLIANQGDGDLGRRMLRVWNDVAAHGPAAFFGMDSPDIPDAAFMEIPRALSGHDAAIGRTPDGGYWTLAARRCLPVLLTGIDWGTDAVYDATVQRAQQGGVSLARLDDWFDVDHPDDVRDLITRLDGRRGGDPAITRLARDLRAILPTLPSEPTIP